MNNRYFTFLLIAILFFSCSKDARKVKIMEIPVDFEQDISLPLSEITEELTAITLELTDETPINPDFISRVLFCEDYLIVVLRDNILIFNTDGKFVRTIGAKGQASGEYVGGIRHVTLDEKNKRLFVYSVPKIICYDLDGTFIKEFELFQDSPKAEINYIANINYVNDELLLLAEHIFSQDEKGFFNQSTLYRLNNEFQITDSCTIRKVYVDMFSSPNNPYEEHILYNDSSIYLYYSDLSSSNRTNRKETILRDTLYRLEKNYLIPELKLKFKDNGIEDFFGYKYILLCNIYRSTRYVFAIYLNDLKTKYNHFCYDTKTGECYNMVDGYTDDINRIEQRANIRPFSTNIELFYYWHSYTEQDNPEKTHLTLYIGKLKQ